MLRRPNLAPPAPPATIGTPNSRPGRSQADLIGSSFSLLRPEIAMPPAGLEPATGGLGNRCPMLSDMPSGVLGQAAGRAPDLNSAPVAAPARPHSGSPLRCYGLWWRRGAVSLRASGGPHFLRRYDIRWRLVRHRRRVRDAGGPFRTAPVDDRIAGAFKTACDAVKRLSFALPVQSVWESTRASLVRGRSAVGDWQLADRR